MMFKKYFIRRNKLSNLSIRIEKVRNAGACNFCTRGELQMAKEGTSIPQYIGLKYPYDTVYVVTGNSLSVNFCSECLKFLKDKK